MAKPTKAKRARKARPARAKAARPRPDGAGGQDLEELRRRLESDRALIQKLLKDVEQRAELLGLVNGVLRTIISGAELPEILRVFASNLKAVCPFDRCSISLYDEKEGVFHVPYMVFRGRVTETGEPARPFASTPLSEVVRTGRPLLRQDIAGEGGRFHSDTDFSRKGIACEMLFPLQVGGKPFGTFNLAAFEPRSLTESHLALLADLVPAVAVAAWNHVRRKTPA